MVWLKNFRRCNELSDDVFERRLAAALLYGEFAQLGGLLEDLVAFVRVEMPDGGDSVSRFFLLQCSGFSKDGAGYSQEKHGCDPGRALLTQKAGVRQSDGRVIHCIK